MRIVIQKVENAEVMEEQTLISKINQGIVIYVGIDINESKTSVDWLIEQIKQRITPLDEVLILSQITLFAQFKSGKPNFHRAEKPSEAESYFYNAVSKIKEAFPGKIQHGIFGRKLEINLNFKCPNAEFLEN